MKNSGEKEERLMLLESWQEFEVSLHTVFLGMSQVFKGLNDIRAQFCFQFQWNLKKNYLGAIFLLRVSV